MKQTYTGIGGCVGCEVCYRSPDICPQCVTVETVCDACGGLICGEGISEDDDEQDV